MPTNFRILRRAAALLAAGLAVLAAQPAAAQSSEGERFMSGGVMRDYRYFAPAADGPLPAVFLLHGGTSNGRAMERYSGFNALAAAEGIVAVYPDGFGRHWNDGRVEGKRSQADDLGFLAAIVERLAARGLVDPARVYFAGISNGGMMAQRVACEGGGLAAGIAVVATSMPADAECAAARPLPVILLTGTEDRYVDYRGGPILGAPEKYGSTIGVEATVAFWARVNGCGAAERTALPDADPGDATRASLLRYDCPPGRGLESVVVEGGGHTWPGARQGPVAERLLGRASRDIDANRLLWDFFSRQAR